MTKGTGHQVTKPDPDCSLYHLRGSRRDLTPGELSSDLHRCATLSDKQHTNANKQPPRNTSYFNKRKGPYLEEKSLRFL